MTRERFNQLLEEIIQFAEYNDVTLKEASEKVKLTDDEVFEICRRFPYPVGTDKPKPVASPRLAKLYLYRHANGYKQILAYQNWIHSTLYDC